MRNATIVLFVLFVVLAVSGCADANLAEDNLEFCGRNLSGFFWGLWHGIIAPFSLIGSLFSSDIAVYDICNVGGWYDFGFCLGVGAFTHGSGSAASTAAGDSKRGEGGSSLTGWWGASEK